MRLSGVDEVNVLFYAQTGKHARGVRLIQFLIKTFMSEPMTCVVCVSGVDEVNMLIAPYADMATRVHSFTPGQRNPVTEVF